MLPRIMLYNLMKTIVDEERHFYIKYCKIVQL